MNIEDLKLELIALQKLDTENALKENITDKRKWLNACLSKPNDEIAQCIIDLSKRYNIKEIAIAKIFDETMVYRVLNILKKDKKKSITF